MGERLKNTFIIFLFTFGCGLMLAIFPFIQSPFNLIFSLLAFVIGIFFFKRYSTISLRIMFFILSLVFFVLWTMIIVIITHPLPEA